MKKFPQRKTNCFLAPNKIFDRYDITGYEKLIYLYLCRRANQYGQCFPSYNRMAKDCSSSRRSVIRYVKSLEEKGLVRKTYRYREEMNTSNLFTVTSLFDEDFPEDKGEQKEVLESKASKPEKTQSDISKVSTLEELIGLGFSRSKAEQLVSIYSLQMISKCIVHVKTKKIPQPETFVMCALQNAWILK